MMRELRKRIKDQLNKSKMHTKCKPSTEDPTVYLIL